MPVLFSDDFTGPAGQTLGARANWTFVGGTGGPVEINGANQLRSANTLAAGVAYTTPDLGTPDHWVKWRFLTDNCLPFVCIRLLNNQTWGAGCRMASGSLVVWQRNSGTYTLLQDFGPVPGFDPADEWEMRPSGASAQILRNGVAYGSPFALNIQATRTFAGLFGRSTPVDPWLDDFSAGDLSAGNAWDATATMVAAPGQLIAAGSHARPAHALSAPLLAAPGRMTAGAAHAPPGVSLAATLAAAPATMSAAGAHIRPAHAMAVALLGSPAQVTAAGAHTRPGHALSGTMAAAPAQVTAGATHAAPGVSLSAVMVAAPGQMAAAASHTRPAHGLSGSLVTAPARIAASGAHAAPGVSLSTVMVAAAGRITATADHGPPPPMVPAGGAPVVVALSVAPLLIAEARLAPLLTLRLEMEGTPMTTTLRPIAGEEMELRLRVRTPAGGLVAAGGVSITAKPPGGAPLRTYTAVASGIGDWTATVLFDVPGRWWVSGACQTPSRAVAEFPVEVRARAVQ